MAKTKEKKQSVGVGVYDIERFLPGKWSSSSPPDPLDKILALQAKDLARRAKTVSVESFIAQKEAEISKIKGSNLGGGSGEKEALIRALFNDPKIRSDWLALDDTSRVTLLTTVNALSQEGQNQNTLSMYLPFMLAQQKQNPQTSMKDMVEFFKIVSGGKGNDTGNSKNMLEAIRLGFDMSQKNKPGWDSPGNIFKETMNVLKPFYDTLSNKDKELYKQQFDVLRSQIQPLRMQLKDAGEVASLLGYQKGTGSQLETQLAIKKMEMDHQRFMAEQGWKHEEWRDKVLYEREESAKRLLFDRETEKNRWDTILAIGTKWMDKASPILDAGIGAAQKRIIGNPNQPSSPGNSALVNISCVKCGTDIPVVGDPDSITCPNCKLVHNKNVLADPKKIGNVEEVK